MSCQFFFWSIFFLVKGSELYFLSQIMSIEDVERIMDETREGIEYQRVSDINWKALISAIFNQMLTKILIFFPQEIDELLSGSLTQEDEDAVLQELEEMTKVCTLYLCCPYFHTRVLDHEQQSGNGDALMIQGVQSQPPSQDLSSSLPL